MTWLDYTPPKPATESGWTVSRRPHDFSPLATSSVCPVLPLLVFFVLLFVGTLGAEPLYLFWGCSRNPNARPGKEGEISVSVE